MLKWKQIRVLDSVYKKINDLGKCGMTKNDVIEGLIDFYEKCKELKI